MHVTMCDYLLELVHNAVESGADVVDLQVVESSKGLTGIVTDDGCGMTPEQLQVCRNPYATAAGKHPRRRAGLGLSLLDHLLKDTGGRLVISSMPGKGTRVTARFNGRNIDTPPVGDLVDFFLCALCFHGGHELRIERRLMPADGAPVNGYRLSRREIREALGDLEDITSLTALRRFLRQKEDACRCRVYCPTCVN